MGRANQAKKKQWRQLPTPTDALQSQYTETTVALPADQLFVLDRKGDQRVPKTAYPDKFAKAKPTASSAKPAAAEKKNEKKKAETEVFDLWGDAAKTESKAAKDESKGHIPAVIPPLPGQSYNPHQPDLQTVWSKVVEEEVAKDTKAAEYQKSVHGFTVVEQDEEVQNDSEDEGSVSHRKNPPTGNKKPTKAKVNKKMRWLMRLREDEEARKQKELNKAVEHIPKIIAESEAKKAGVEEAKAATLKRKREEKEAEAAGLKAPKLQMGQFVYQLPETEATYSAEPKALRQMQAKATAVDTCFDSLVRRGKVDLCDAKRKPRMVVRNRYTGESSREWQQAREIQKREAAAGTIKFPGSK